MNEKSRHSKPYKRLLATLQQARNDAGVTQVEAARHFGRHASFISKCESGERRIDVVELSEFCRLYGVKLAAFLKSAGIE